MMLTVTLNAALDVTYLVDALVPHSSHRVHTAYERAGGKGINVARVLSGRGCPATVTGLAGGTTGRSIHDDLRSAGIRDELVGIPGASRRTVTVVSGRDGDATVFNPPGPRVDAAGWACFLDRFASLVRGAGTVVLSGSLPPGLPVDAYAQLIRLSAEAGAATVLDTSGPALLAGLEADPTVVKPNATEITEVTGEKNIEAAAHALRAGRSTAVVASCGPEGIHALTPQGAWRATPPRALSGNPTGAGDACVAALAAGIRAGDPWPEILREAVALSAATLPCARAGDVATDVYEEFRTAVGVERVPYS
ncbi:1-phosphofructokinase family hexose kinase [Streptomyces sp. NPDC047967]|uniref:1-phosphofructokinase family hexose kinase n=1 Tax=unclassified Streptomyces TaxID=2593676 RepID=UPI003400C221